MLGDRCKLVVVENMKVSAKKVFFGLVKALIVIPSLTFGVSGLADVSGTYNLLGSWKAAPTAEAFQLGVLQPDGYFQVLWGFDERVPCFWDDIFTFGAHGSFTQTFGEQTLVRD